VLYLAAEPVRSSWPWRGERSAELSGWQPPTAFAEKSGCFTTSRNPSDMVGVMARSHSSEFLVAERYYSDNESKLSVGLANIEAVVPDIVANKDKMLRALEIFKDRRVNAAVFPEFSLSGYFWDDEAECRRYMDQAVIENHLDWVEKSLRPMLDENLKAIVFNNLRRGPGDAYFNSTYVVSDRHGVEQGNLYDKVFLPGIEKKYTKTGQDDRLVIDSRFGRFGFTTCYDLMFAPLLLEYARIDKIDAIIQIASWRAMARRDYPTMNIKTDVYYGYLWDLMLAATSAANQIWTIACNAVGRHGISGVTFWGGSGIWAPSGMPLVQASRTEEELLIVHNIDMQDQRQAEQDDFNYALEFSSIYRPIHGKRSFTRV
jgi:predicted amidohydrolase